MKISIDKCEYCGRTFEDPSKYQDHVKDEDKKRRFLAKYPEVECDTHEFANGGWNVQRSREWVKQYRFDIVELAGESIRFSPFSYGWFRVLDDSGSLFYSLACRPLNICSACNREWGQPYYANHCNHKDKKPERVKDA